MEPGTQIALTMGISHGAALLLAIRELWLLRRPGWRPDPEPPREPQPWPGGGGTQPVVRLLKPLPDCLIPRPLVPGNRRVLEDA